MACGPGRLRSDPGGGQAVLRLGGWAGSSAPQPSWDEKYIHVILELGGHLTAFQGFSCPCVRPALARLSLMSPWL